MAYAQWSQGFEEYTGFHSWPMEPSMRGTRFVSHSLFMNFPDPQYAYNAPPPPAPGGLPVTYIEPPSQVIQQSQIPLQNSVARRKQSPRRRRKLHQEFYDRYTTISRTMTVVRSNDPYRPIAYVPTRKTVFLSRKPGHWRKGYKSPSSKGKFGSYLGKITSIIARSPSSFHLNPLISHHTRHSTCISFDIRIRPSPDTGLLTMNPRRSVDPIEFYQLATSPPTLGLLIWHPKLPWKIHIEASTPTHGVTIQDILFGIHEQLRCSIGHNEYYTVELTSEDRQALSDVFQERCAGDAAEMVGGLRRVDFLGRDVCFMGLSRSHNGTWEMKTTAVPRRRMIID